MKEIFSGIWQWSIFNQDKQIDFNGWCVKRGDEVVVIDPPTPSQDVLAAIQKIGRPTAVLLTNKHHTRATEVIRRNFDSLVWIHEADKKLMEIPVDRTFKSGDSLPCGLQAVTVKDGKTPGETAFFLSGEAPILFVGDALIGKPSGSVSMLPADKFKDPDRAKEGLKVLLKYKFEALLLGDGEPILSNGRGILQTFLKPA